MKDIIDLGDSLACKHYSSSLKQSSTSAYVKTIELIIAAAIIMSASLLWGILPSALLYTLAYLNLTITLEMGTVLIISNFQMRMLRHKIIK